MKLSRELSKRSTGRTLYILDEPTTGLHFDDIRKLLRVLDRLVEAGNTVVVIEHNLDGGGDGISVGTRLWARPPDCLSVIRRRAWAAVGAEE